MSLEAALLTLAARLKESGGEPLSAAEELGQEDWPGGPQPRD